jgi:hypothetical protein
MKILNDRKIEFLDRINIIGGMIDELLLHHDVCSYDSDIKDIIESAGDHLWEAMLMAEKLLDTD